MELMKLTKEIDDLSHWLNDYAEDRPEEERTKMSDIMHYMSILKQLIAICPAEILGKVQP